MLPGFFFWFAFKKKLKKNSACFPATHSNFATAKTTFGPLGLFSIPDVILFRTIVNNTKIMVLNIVTLEDLQEFRRQLMEELKQLLSQRQTTPVRKWLKSHEVRRLLTISAGTLQNLRVNGTLPFTKIGGVLYYDYDDIQKMLEGRKTQISPEGHTLPGNHLNKSR